MAVVLAHAGTVLGSSDALGYVPMRGIFRAGHAGVDVFFVLSGFIITLVHHGDIGRPRVCLDYVWKRCTRIFPMYWIALAVLTLTVSVGLAHGVEPTDVWTVVTLFLWPQHRSPPLGVMDPATRANVLSAVRYRDSQQTTWHGRALCLADAHGVQPAPSEYRSTVGADQSAVGLCRLVLPSSVLARDRGRRRGRGGSRSTTAHAARHRGRRHRVTAAIDDLGAIAYLGVAGQALFGAFSAFAIAGMATAERRGPLSAGQRQSWAGKPPLRSTWCIFR
jgi:hypothetical protein